MKLRKYETATTRERQPDGLLERTLAAIIAAGIFAFVAAVATSIVMHRIVWQAAAVGLFPLVAHAIQLMAWMLDVPRVASDDIRLVPVRTRSTVDGIERGDLAHFVRTVAQTGDTTQRAWRGKKLPSGATCSNEMHAAMVRALEKAGYLVDRGPRSAGRLTCRDGDEMLRRMGL